ncbi:Gfo/Idh/MocA family oxidoreductase [Shouchella shacheensis]|uniref:Gfo/Idh/MocA family oxidoreductase n=1 Tax=Shouchella shacheensis TaxID=1649580 RepID=UPI000ADEE24D|nr:Gfo/Idh/MocA family oxidoreductase [Shouchella shacheensis]
MASDVDDEASFLVNFKNGSVGSIEATRNAWGRNNYITIELHGTKGSILFNYERLNELQVCFSDDPDDRRGFKTIYTGPAHDYGEITWNIPGMNIGYGELKTIESYDFLKAVTEGVQPSTTFEEAYKVDRVCEAVMRSSESRSWEKVK